MASPRRECRHPAGGGVQRHQARAWIAKTMALPRIMARLEIQKPMAIQMRFDSIPIWQRMGRPAARWLPPAHIMHPWPEQRFGVRTRGKSPVR